MGGETHAGAFYTVAQRGKVVFRQDRGKLSAKRQLYALAGASHLLNARLGGEHAGSTLAVRALGQKQAQAQHGGGGASDAHLGRVAHSSALTREE